MTKVHRQRNKHQSGAVLLICLILITASSWITFSQSRHSQTNLRLIALIRASEVAFDQAERAIEHTANTLYENPAEFVKHAGLSATENSPADHIDSTVSVVYEDKVCGPEKSSNRYIVEIGGYGSARAMNNQIIERTHVRGYEICISKTEPQEHTPRVRNTYWYPLTLQPGENNSE